MCTTLDCSKYLSSLIFCLFFLSFPCFSCVRATRWYHLRDNGRVNWWRWCQRSHCGSVQGSTAHQWRCTCRRNRLGRQIRCRMQLLNQQCWSYTVRKEAFSISVLEMSELSTSGLFWKLAFLEYGNILSEREFKRQLWNLLHMDLRRWVKNLWPPPYS